MNSLAQRESGFRAGAEGVSHHVSPGGEGRGPRHWVGEGWRGGGRGPARQGDGRGGVRTASQPAASRGTSSRRVTWGQRGHRGAGRGTGHTHPGVSPCPPLRPQMSCPPPHLEKELSEVMSFGVRTAGKLRLGCDTAGTSGGDTGRGGHTGETHTRSQPPPPPPC